MDYRVVKAWLKPGFGDGFGFGFGDGAGDGAHYGYGSGYGYGDGDGSGSGYGYGAGDGAGAGYKINNEYISRVDGIPTIIKSIKGQIAKGYIAKDDLSTAKTYIVKSLDNNYFAHGESIKKAFESLEKKIIADLDEEAVIEMFISELDVGKKYKFEYFFNWHGKLTGSCLQGREVFCENKCLEMEQEMDIHEFLDICEGEDGWIIMEKVKGMIAGG